MFPPGSAEETVYWTLVWLVFGVGAAVFLLLLFVTAPYGRHARSGWGPTMPSRFSWVVMESPTVLAFIPIFFMGPNAGNIVPLVLLVMWQLHYFNRTFIYPFRTYRDNRHQTAIVVAFMGASFQAVNVYVNARWISMADYDASWLTDPRFLVGAVLFAYGSYTNRWADAVPRRLKAEGRGYQIPRGGLYERVSCPNYFGEILVWTGWALATWSWAGVAFLWFTAANLIPRALSNHNWYRQKFADYPADRRAVIPGLL